MKGVTVLTDNHFGGVISVAAPDGGIEDGEQISGGGYKDDNPDLSVGDKPIAEELEDGVVKGRHQGSEEEGGAYAGPAAPEKLLYQISSVRTDEVRRTTAAPRSRGPSLNEKNSLRLGITTLLAGLACP